MLRSHSKSHQFDILKIMAKKVHPSKSPQSGESLIRAALLELKIEYLPGVATCSAPNWSGKQTISAG
jgi:hypothetical protein